MRLHEDPIAVMGTVGTYSAIVPFHKAAEIPRVIFWPLLAMLCTLLAFSLTRSASFLFSPSCYLLAGDQRALFVRKLGFLFLAILPFVFFFYILPALQEYHATDSIATLTGRTDLSVYLVGSRFCAHHGSAFNLSASRFSYRLRSSGWDTLALFLSRCLPRRTEPSAA